MSHLGRLQRFPEKNNWMKESGSEVAGGVKTPNQPNQRPQIQLLEQGDLLRQKKRPVQVFRKSTNVSYLAARVPMCLLNVQMKTRRRRNVDADRVKTERPVGSERLLRRSEKMSCLAAKAQTRMVRLVTGQPPGLFTQREEIDIDFRVSGLPHAVVKQAENFRVRELVKKIESHPHRQALQADLQQRNAYNPLVKNQRK